MLRKRKNWKGREYKKNIPGRGNRMITGTEL